MEYFHDHIGKFLAVYIPVTLGINLIIWTSPHPPVVAMAHFLMATVAEANAAHTALARVLGWL